jgi:hypothetical protein
VERNLVLDAGALIGLERGSEMMVAMADQAEAMGGETVIPASVLGQVWRGGPRSARLSRLISGCEIDPLDERRAKEVGSRLGTRQATDVTDAHVVCCAVERNAIVATSDQGDIRALVEADEVVRVLPV